MKSQLCPRFDTPLFNLVPHPGPRQWANVSNQLEVLHRNREYVVSLSVSATLFQVMHALGVGVESTVTLYLEDDGPRMVFGMVVDDERLIDLWHYTLDKVPPQFKQL